MNRQTDRHPGLDGLPSVHADEGAGGGGSMTGSVETNQVFLILHIPSIWLSPWALDLIRLLFLLHLICFGVYGWILDLFQSCSGLYSPLILYTSVWTRGLERSFVWLPKLADGVHVSAEIRSNSVLSFSLGRRVAGCGVNVRCWRKSEGNGWIVVDRWWWLGTGLMGRWCYSTRLVVLFVIALFSKALWWMVWEGLGETINRSSFPWTLKVRKGIWFFEAPRTIVRSGKTSMRSKSRKSKWLCWCWVSDEGEWEVEWIVYHASNLRQQTVVVMQALSKVP